MGAVMKVGAVFGLLFLWLNAIAIHAGIASDGALSLAKDVVVSDAVREGLGYLPGILITLAVLSLLLGTFSALGQTSLRRLMAYSGVAHAGYLLWLLFCPRPASAIKAFPCGRWSTTSSPTPLALRGLMLAATVMAGDGEDGDSLDKLSGSGRRLPFAGLCFTVLTASLAGLPPTAGFLGKFMVLGRPGRQGRIRSGAHRHALGLGRRGFLPAPDHRHLGQLQDQRRGKQRVQSAVPASGLVTFALILAVVATIALLFMPLLMGGQA